MEKIKIGDFVIEKNSRPFIVGEVGNDRRSKKNWVECY